MRTLTAKQLEVLIDVICSNDAWRGVRRGDGRRLKTVQALLEGEYITIGLSGSLAKATDRGLAYVQAMLPTRVEI